jgi:hypothetical protein
MRDITTHPDRRIYTTTGWWRGAVHTAIHVAAHAVAACRYRDAFHVVHLTVGAANRDGCPIEAVGLCETKYPFLDHTIWPHISYVGSNDDQATAQHESGFRHVVTILAGSIAMARSKRQRLASIYLGGGLADFNDAKLIVKYLALNDADEKVIWHAAEVEAWWFVREHWHIVIELAETLAKHGKIEFDQAPASVRAIKRIEGNIAPLAPPDALRVHECARIFAETGGKICETARHMGVCQRTVGRYLSYALQASLRQPLGH